MLSYQLYIDGAWTGSDGDAVLTVLNPATEEAIGTVPEGTPADIDRAVAAARRAFDEGPWPWLAPRERAAILLRFAEELEARTADLVRAQRARGGLDPLLGRVPPGRAADAAPAGHGRAGAAAVPVREADGADLRRRHLRLVAGPGGRPPRAVRRRGPGVGLQRAHHAEPGQAGAGAGGGLHGGTQARPHHTARDVRARRGGRRGGAAAWRAQHRDRRHRRRARP